MKAIIFDIDQTICTHNGRGPFEWSKISSDLPIPYMRDLNAALDSFNDRVIIFVTGRPEICRQETEKWLEEHGFVYNKLYMKPNPYEKGFIYKERVLKEILKNYEVIAAYDDEIKCAEMYKNNGIFILRPLNYVY